MDESGLYPAELQIALDDWFADQGGVEHLEVLDRCVRTVYWGHHSADREEYVFVANLLASGRRVSGTAYTGADAMGWRVVGVRIE